MSEKLPQEGALLHFEDGDKKNMANMNIMKKSILGKLTKSHLHRSGKDTGLTKGKDISTCSLSKKKIRESNLAISQRHCESEVKDSFLPLLYPEASKISKSGRGSKVKFSSETNVVKFSRLDDAINIANKLKSLRREDVVRRGFDNYVDRNSGNAQDMSMDRDSLVSGSIGLESADPYIPENKTVTNTKRAKVPGLYQFPKASDFIPVGQPKRSTELGLDWKFCKENVDEVSTSKGKLSKSLYPVAEAQRREQTAPERVRGKTLGRGEWNVTKVWPRKLSEINASVLPVQMALEDVSRIERHVRLV